MQRTLYSADHDAYRQTVAQFVAREVAPNFARWETQQLIDRETWRRAGAQGVLGVNAPAEYGGGGQRDYRYRMIVCEELARVGCASLASGFGVQDDIVIPYVQHLGTAEQKQRWLPGLISGELIGAIAMTEPGAGSDLKGITTRATPAGDCWVLNGQKTFISNGILSDIVIVAARNAGPPGAKGFTLLAIENHMPGFERGRKLDKIGLVAQDTAELYFTDVRVPPGNLLGEPGKALGYLMNNLPQERLAIANNALANADAILAETVQYCFRRSAFQQPIGDFQHIRFVLAELATELDVARTYFDATVLAFNRGDVSPVDAAKAKWWISELETRVMDRCLQLHGGYGYMREQRVARAFLDARIETIYGGTTEIMKEIIGRDIADVARRDAVRV